MGIVGTVTTLRRSTLIGLSLLLVTTIGWGLNWPATKYLLTECPPLTARGVAGVVASIALAGLARWRGEPLTVPPGFRLHLLRAALLNVSAWMGLTTLSLLWLSAGQAVTLAYTMPVWAAILAWPVLGERLGTRRVLALLLGLGGVAITVGGNGFTMGRAATTGICVALAAATLFALGTVLSKRWPIAMPPIAVTAWQVGIGCIPLLAAGIIFEHAHLLLLPVLGWAALAYTAAVSLGLCYVAWFGALKRLRAGTAAIGTLLTPVIGVVASSLTLGEPLRLPQFASLTLVIAAVVLAARD